MKIDHLFKSIGSVVNDSPTGKSAKPDVAKPVPGVSVELSGMSSLLQAQASSGEVVDAARVSKIKQAITEGRFEVHPDVVADRLLQAVHELITAHKP